ncbi:MAG: hypothetical protein SOU19_01630 [Candidatus Caccosoma sp.]|nr:hypothetical protein [Candidatus Caccosoma sp.]
MKSINVTDARKDMSSFFDSVIHEKPLILKRRKYEAVLVEKSLMSMMLEYAKINVSSMESEKKWIYRASDLDVFGEGESKVEALNALCEALINYANEVYDNFMFYYYGQNIKSKLPYIFNILLCESIEDVKNILVYCKTKKKK